MNYDTSNADMVSKKIELPELQYSVGALVPNASRATHSEHEVMMGYCCCGLWRTLPAQCWFVFAILFPNSSGTFILARQRILKRKSAGFKPLTLKGFGH